MFRTRIGTASPADPIGAQLSRACLSLGAFPFLRESGLVRAGSV